MFRLSRIIIGQRQPDGFMVKSGPILLNNLPAISLNMYLYLLFRSSTKFDLHMHYFCCHNSPSFKVGFFVFTD